MPMTFTTISSESDLGIAGIMTYLILWLNVFVNRGVRRKSLGRFKSAER
jgi:hypothetical protein